MDAKKKDHTKNAKERLRKGRKEKRSRKERKGNGHAKDAKESVTQRAQRKDHTKDAKEKWGNDLNYTHF
jgi:hypothetical protein